MQTFVRHRKHQQSLMGQGLSSSTVCNVSIGIFFFVIRQKKCCGKTCLITDYWVHIMYGNFVTFIAKQEISVFASLRQANTVIATVQCILKMWNVLGLIYVSFFQYDCSPKMQKEISMRNCAAQKIIFNVKLNSIMCMIFTTDDLCELKVTRGEGGGGR